MPSATQAFCHPGRMLACSAAAQAQRADAPPVLRRWAPGLMQRWPMAVRCCICYQAVRPTGRAPTAGVPPAGHAPTAGPAGPLNGSSPQRRDARGVMRCRPGGPLSTTCNPPGQVAAHRCCSSTSVRSTPCPPPPFPLSPQRHPGRQEPPALGLPGHNTNPCMHTNEMAAQVQRHRPSPHAQQARAPGPSQPASQLRQLRPLRPLRRAAPRAAPQNLKLKAALMAACCAAGLPTPPSPYCAGAP